ncbi:MAG: peroxidase family protein, partial [Alphaproteobacteria bacterium]
AKDIRETFARMAMNDEETVALIAGGHTFGKVHGAHKPEKCLDKEPAGAGLEEQGLGWKNKCGKGNGVDTVTSGLEGAWTASPTEFTTQYLDNLFAFEWKKTKSKAGATQWIPTDESAKNLVPDAHDPNQRHAPIMLTTDLSLRFDPEYSKIAKRFQQNPKEFEKAFANAWFKLTHRDMGPSSSYIGKDAPKQQFIWQDPLPKANYKMIDAKEIEDLKAEILRIKIAPAELIKTAWASASTYRNTDKRGGANGARISLEPQKNWAVNNPKQLEQTLKILQEIQKSFNKKLDNNKKVSLADVIVIAGSGAIEKSARLAGYSVKVPVKIGRVDALQEQTDVNSFALLEPKADGFRNYFAKDNQVKPIAALIEKAKTLDLSVPEMTVLVGGLRAIGVNADGSEVGIFTKNRGKLSNEFFVNLLDNNTKWQKAKEEGFYEGFDLKSKEVKWRGSPVDLVFGSSSELRAVTEYYALDGNEEIFVKDFIKAWTKVMELDLKK